MVQPSIPGTAVGIPRMVYGNDGTNWIAVLVDALGHIQADILSTVLPTDAATETTLLLIKGYVDTLETLLAGGLPAALDSGALKTKEQSPLTGFATSANQTTMITALQLIDDLRNALGSVNIDKILVASKSGDKIFGFESIVEQALNNLNLSAGTNFLTGTAVSAGKVWKVTEVHMLYFGTVAIVHLLLRVSGLAGALVLIDKGSGSVTSGQWYIWSGEIYMQVGDFIELVVLDATAGDDAYLEYTGVQMNAP